MSQNDFNLANQGFPSMRADINSAFQALATNSSGATAPPTTYAHQWWYDTGSDTLKIRNEGNDAWIDLAVFNQITDSWSFTSVDINGGTIDGSVIGGTTPADGNFTTTTTDNISDGTDTVETGYVVNGSAKAWVNFNGTGTVAIRDSLNVASLTDSGTGDYGVNYSSVFSSASFSVVDSSMGSVTFPPSSVNFNNHMIAGNPNPSQTLCYFGFYTTSGGFTDAHKVHIAAFGDLA